MLRLALIIALLAAVGGIVVSQFVTKPKVAGLRTDLEMTQTTLTQTQSDLASSRQKEQAATALAERTTAELADTSSRLEVASRDLQVQRGRADRLDEDLNRTTGERNRAQAELARWEALGVRPEQVADLRDSVRNLNQEKVALLDEKDVFGRQIASLEARLLKYEEPSAKVPLPTGLTGRVVAVSPQNDFVLLDIGEVQGVLERGELLVRRGERMVGKVRIVSVEPTRSVANILPDWSPEGIAIQETDIVIY